MIKLRPEIKNDQAFIEMLYRSTREAELHATNWTEEQKSAFVIMQSMAQLAEYRSRFPGATFEVIEFRKKNAGRLYTWESALEIRLIDITIMPRFRGKGIGTSVLNDLVKRSDRLKKKISLHVDPASPALQLYLKLGFVHVKNNGRLFYMERNAVQ
jgi:ribosomal protein S18 acetylase RimI-like enzyme